MARTIHQLYCTHCTYGTSALHRHTGNVQAQPFEYSTRAGSVEQSLSHQTFQRFEKQFFRGIPMAGDAPVDVRRRDASNAPWRRMVYSPSVDGLRLLANVCYRTTDTAGRLGSYFAHVLLEEEGDGGGPWNPTDCLKLWGASFWRTIDRELADSANESFVLQELHELDSVNCPGYGAIVNDQALTEFLTSPAIAPNLRSGGRESPGNATDLLSGGREPPGNNKTETSSDNGDACKDLFSAPNHRQDAYATGTNDVAPCLDVFPPRWRAKKPEERKQLLTDLLHAVMELDLKNQERLTIAVEPGVAALLFYGVFRLLPLVGTVPQLSFSTFESHLERPATILTAHDFADPKSTDLLPETYRFNGIRGFAINTYRSMTGFKFRHPVSKFAEMTVQTFVSGGGAATNRLVDQLTPAGDLTWDQRESLASIDRRVAGFLTNDVSPEDFSQLSKIEKSFAGQRLAAQLATASDEAIKSLSRHPAYVSALDLISRVNNAEAHRVVKRLVRVLPAKSSVLNAFFALPKISVPVKVWLLRSYLEQKQQFPQNCLNLWFKDSLQPNDVVSKLLQEATPEQISIWHRSVPPECAWSFAAALGIAAQSDAGKRPMLISVIEGLDDDGLCKLLDKPSGRADILLTDIANDHRFKHRLEQLSDGIRTATSDQVQTRVEALLPIAPQLPFLKVSLNAWASVREAIKRCCSCPLDPSGRLTDELEVALCEVLKALGKALSTQESLRSPIEVDVKLVESLLRCWWDPQRQDLLQQSLRAIPSIQLEATNAASLCAFLAGERGKAWRGNLRQGDASLQQRLRTILNEIPENLPSLPVLLKGLEAASSWLGPEKSKLKRWNQVIKSVDYIKGCRGDVDGARELDRSQINNAAETLARYVYHLFGTRITCKSKRLTDNKYLQELSRATVGDNSLLECPEVREAIEKEYNKKR